MVLVAIPDSLVMVVAVSTFTSPGALKFTAAFGTGFPFASVTITCTALVAEPLATASLLVTVNAPLAIPAVLLSGIKVISAVLLLPLTNAVTS